MARDTPPLPNDGLYRAILIVLVLSVIAGGLLALAGELVYHDQTISQFGGWVAVVCGAIYFVFRWFGRREARKRASGERRPGEWPPDEPDE